MKTYKATIKILNSFCLKKMIVFCIYFLTLVNIKAQPVSEVASLKQTLDTLLRFAYYPSFHQIEVDIDHLPSGLVKSQLSAKVEIWSDNHQLISKRDFLINENGAKVFIGLPELADGTYELQIDTEDFSIKRIFLHKNFKWLGNDYGKSDKVFLPYEPVRIKGNEASVVLRTYTMNAFGLWDQVISEGKEILAEPVKLHFKTSKGEAKWEFKPGEWISKTENKAIYRAEAETPQLRVKIVSSVEYDGCMKVEMELLPGKSKEPIQSLWLDLPIKNSEATLFHYSAIPEIRRNYSGAMPNGGKIKWSPPPGDTNPPTWPRGAKAPEWTASPGNDDGLLWTNRDVWPWWHVWKTEFVPYIWVGGVTRGIAWFGASPRNYNVRADVPMQRLVRDHDTLRVIIEFINKPTILEKPSTIIFGLQASPTRPMPENWRSNVAIPGIDLGVHCAPYGAHICPDKYPDDEDFRVAEEMIKTRQTGVVDTMAFKKLDKDRSPHFKYMTNHQDTTWLAWVLHDAMVNQAFAIEGDSAYKGYIKGALLVPYRYHIDEEKHVVNPVWEDAPKDRLYPDRVADKIIKAPLAIYFEEHASTIENEEWVVYQDEWRGDRMEKERSYHVDEPRVTHNNFNVGHQNFPSSYRDFALWYANEWMKRGISIYCDNVYLHLLYNPLTSEAFWDGDGDLQPAASLWEMREYHKRLWILAQEWNEKKTLYPITITHHMTNSIMLPISTWNDAMLDLEYPINSRKINPFLHDYLLAQATGHQTGSYRHLLEPVIGVPGKLLFKRPINKTDSCLIKAEWGMRMVHEAMRWVFPHENFAAFEPARTLEKALWNFGYGTDECQVINYWSEDKPLTVTDPNVKWLLVKKECNQSIFLVLQSYEQDGKPVQIKIDKKKLGFIPCPIMLDIENGCKTEINKTSTDNDIMEINTEVTVPYDTKVFIIGLGSEN